MQNVMEIVKKNLISVIAVVIAIAAIVVAMTMVSGDAQKLQQDLDARKQAHDQLKSLATKERTLPTVKLTESTSEKLPRFPSQKIIDQGEVIVKDLTKASNEVFAAAVEMNKHTLLEPGSLPKPSPVNAFNFRERYQQYFPQGGAANLQGGMANPLNSQLAKDLKAGMPPTPNDIQTKIAEEGKKITEKKLYFLPGGQPGNQPQVQAEIDEMARKLPDQLRAQIAAQSKVYINPMTFMPVPGILDASGAPTAENIYLAQLGLWLQQDVVAAVNDANANSNSIKDSVVKHLIRVTAIPNFVLPASGTPSADPDAAAPKEPAISPTGRVSNGMYDVFHINIEADVDAARLPDFLRALGKNRFMTAMWADVQNVDLAMELAKGHAYGEKPVVNVRVQTEVLYLRQWNKPLMPATVRTRLGIPEDSAQPAAAPAEAQPAQ